MDQRRAELELKRERQQTLLAELEETSREFIAVTAANLTQNLPLFVRKVGLPQKQVSLKLGREGLEQLRAAVQTLQDDMSAVCERCLYVPSVWDHLNPDHEFRPREDKRNQDKSQIPALLTQDLEQTYPKDGPRLRLRYAWPLADCLEGLVSLLEDKGFATTSQRAPEEDPAPNHDRVYGQYGWPERALELHSEYREHALRLREVSMEIQDLEEAIAAQELVDLWHLFE